MSKKRFRVLLVTSSYQPAMAADMHRARHLAWELPALGWDVEVLCPDESFQRNDFIEESSAPFFNPATTVHRVAPIYNAVHKVLKMRGIGWRALKPLHRKATELLRNNDFSLVYITTAQFNLFRLATSLSRQFSVPFVLDYHDPWVRDQIDFRTTKHSIKLLVSAVLSNSFERRALAAAAGVVSVSPNYIADLRFRYGSLTCLRPERCAVIPFPASQRDIALAARSNPTATLNPEVIYVGAGGSLMKRAFTTLCEGLSEIRRTHPSLLAGIKFRFLGTSTDWKHGEPKMFEVLARQFGLQDSIEESPSRVSYLEATRLALSASGLLVLGIDGPGYIPSKLFGYSMTGKPLLSIFREDSPAIPILKSIPGLCHCAVFSRNGPLSSDSLVGPVSKFLAEVQNRQVFDRTESLSSYSAKAMTEQHAKLFARVLGLSIQK